MTTRPDLRHILFDSATRLIPKVFAMMLFVIGSLLLVSVLTPIDPDVMPLVERSLPLGLVEFSHAIGTVIGVLMIFVARGLWERIDTAWYMAIALLSAGAVFSFTRELAVVPAATLAICAMLLIPCKSAFNRRSNLLSLSVNPVWPLVSLATLGFIIWLGFFVYKHVPYAQSLWSNFSYHANTSRFLRGVVIILVTIVLLALYRLFGIARRTPPMPEAEDMEQLKAVVAEASNPQAWLALLRDKHILWNDDKTAFLMYGVSGKQWVVMGEPVGPRAETVALCWELKEMASMANARLSFYQISPSMLPLVLDLGLWPYKVGEEAMVDARTFDLAGKKGYGFRQTLKRFESLGAVFEVIAPEALEPHMPRLKAVSDAWLKTKSAKEKGYSLGSFQPDYVRLTPVAVVRIGGEIVAFANLWPTQDKTLLTLDLMRYEPGSPPSVMEYLFLQLILYARDQGYGHFSLGMAPLGGLDAKPLSRAWYKIAAVIYQVGGDFYNFAGLRAYKEKFKPDWQPRYFAVPGQEAALMPALMAVVALGAKAPKKREGVAEQR
ncbi:phosphatidylglycerol lysyltransferase domain-containing protein [Asticcacaulis sp. 201]|uniref:phosphatidylglycerol lysyltransferase domain-containing protein n=1 Tax=Asticcacaulis sp. 201 TaxID=3028787 RepID=UPI0029161C89|nr:phosphatidylglycerol lysyltransferase domain-containing protein [Asticcacaulis sp. 201]MDV6333173.1 phosphatidylglycerol lysyltransferase domain-containing protein [Asticcacaulis sp. 201]